MGTGYFNEVHTVITGTIEEGIGTRHTEIFEKELELLCLKYGLEVEICNAP